MDTLIFFAGLTLLIVFTLLGVWFIVGHLIKSLTLYRKERKGLASYHGYSLYVRTLRVINSAAKCKLCDDYIETHGQEGITRCSCGEIFIDSSYAFHVIGAKSLDNLLDLSIISVDKFTIPKK